VSPHLTDYAQTANFPMSQLAWPLAATLWRETEVCGPTSPKFPVSALMPRDAGTAKRCGATRFSSPPMIVLTAFTESQTAPRPRAQRSCGGDSHGHASHVYWLA
jgi:hypothetical protein